MPQMPNGAFVPPQAMGGASSPVPPPSMPNVPQPQQAQLNPAAAAGAGQGGSATAQGVAQSMPPDAAAQTPPPGQPQAPPPPGGMGGVPTQQPMSMGWQPNQNGLLLYGSGQGPVSGQVPDMGAMTPEGPAATPDAGEMDMMKLSRDAKSGTARRRGGLLVSKAAVDALAQINLQRAARQSAETEEDEQENLPSRAAPPVANPSALSDKLAMRIQKGYSETKKSPKTSPPRWEEGHQFQGSQTKKVKTSSHGGLINVQSMQSQAGQGRKAARALRDIGKAASQRRASAEAQQAATKSSMNRSAVGESGLTAKEKPWSLQGSDAWPSADEMWSGAKKWDSSLPPGKKKPMKMAQTICTKENCDECGASMEAGDNNTCNRCGAKNSYGQKEAQLSETAQGFLDRCREMGLSDMEIIHAVKQASALSPEIASDLEPLIKEADPKRWLGQAVGWGGQQLGRLFGRGGGGTRAGGSFFGRSVPQPAGAGWRSPSLPQRFGVRGSQQARDIGRGFGRNPIRPKPAPSGNVPSGPGWTAPPPPTMLGSQTLGRAGQAVKPYAAAGGRMAGGAITGSQMGEVDSDSSWDNITGGLLGAGYGLFMPRMGPMGRAGGSRAFMGTMAGGGVGGLGEYTGMLPEGSAQRMAQMGGWGGFLSPMATGAKINPNTNPLLSRFGRTMDDAFMKPWQNPLPGGVMRNIKNFGQNPATAIGAAAGPGAMIYGQTGMNMINGYVESKMQQGQQQFMDRMMGESIVGPDGQQTTLGDYLQGIGAMTRDPETGQPQWNMQNMGSGAIQQYFQGMMNDPQASGQMLVDFIGNDQDMQRMALERGWATVGEDGQVQGNLAKVKEDAMALLKNADKYEGLMEGPLGGLLSGFLSASPMQQMLMLGGVLAALVGIAGMAGGNTGMGLGGLGIGAGLLMGGMGMFGGGQQQQQPPPRRQPGPGGGQDLAAGAGPGGTADVPPPTPVNDPGEVDRPQ